MSTKTIETRNKFIPKFEFVIKNSVLTKLLQPLRKLGIHNAELKFEHDKMSFLEMDVSHVIQVKGELFSTVFEQFNVLNEGTINFNIIELFKVLKMFGNKDFITISCDSENQMMISGPKINVEFHTNEIDKYDRFKVKLNLETKFMIWEKTEFIANLKKTFAAGHYIVIEIPKMKKDVVNLKIWSKVKDAISINKVEFSIKAKVLNGPNKPFNISYSNEYLIDFLQSGFSEEIIFELDQGFPIHVIIPVDAKSKLECWIAPRIPENTDLLP